MIRQVLHQAEEHRWPAASDQTLEAGHPRNEPRHNALCPDEHDSMTDRWVHVTGDTDYDEDRTVLCSL